MPRLIQTAVAASISEILGRQIARALGTAEITLEALARDASEVHNALLRFRPDLLVLDAELPVTDGITLGKRILSRFEFPVQPAVLLIVHADLPLPQALSAAALKVPFSDTAFLHAVEILRSTLPEFPQAKLQRIDALLTELGVPNHLGRACLKAACLLCAADERLRTNMRGRLYPLTGEICGCMAEQAERAMRHAIALAWQSNQLDNQYRIFRDTIDAGRGQPTCREMISRLADILRLEG